MSSSQLPRGNGNTLTSQQVNLRDWQAALDEEAVADAARKLARTCECGALKVYGEAQAASQPYLHSFWCPAYKDTREQESSTSARSC